MRKKTFIAIIALLLTGIMAGGFFLFQAPSAQTAASDNVHGWAWSGDDIDGGNIGWISFNCTEGGSGQTDICGTSNYGITIDTTDLIGGGSYYNMKGYAWSSNVGWINFDPSGPYPASPNHSVGVNTNTKEIYGWARAENSTDQDYGWIKFDNYDPSVDTYIDSSGDFHGWGWGGGPTEEAVIGWISLNCADPGICAQSDYKVWTANVAPYATNTDVTPPSDDEFCTASKGGAPAQYTLSWTFNDDNDLLDDTMQAYEIEVTDTDTGTTGNWQITGLNYPDGSTVNRPVEVRSSQQLTSNPDEPIYLTYEKSYSWRVKVQDSNGAWSSWETGPNFNVPTKYPKASFTYSPSEPTLQEEITFDSSASEVYDGSTPRFDWDFDASDGLGWDITNTTATQVTWSYNEIGEYTVTLQVKDQDPQTAHCREQKTIRIEPQPGEWEEVIPR